MHRNKTRPAWPQTNQGTAIPIVWASSLVLAAVLLAAPNRQTTPVHADENPASAEFYTARVRPILETNCYRCHGGMNHRGGLNMETQASLRKGGHSGPALVAGDPAQSLLVRLMRHEGPPSDPMPMPPAPRPKLSDTDIRTVEQWIRAGAVMPPDTPKP